MWNFGFENDPNSARVGKKCTKNDADSGRPYFYLPFQGVMKDVNGFIVVQGLKCAL